VYGNWDPFDWVEAMMVRIRGSAAARVVENMHS